MKKIYTIIGLLFFLTVTGVFGQTRAVSVNADNAVVNTNVLFKFTNAVIRVTNGTAANPSYSWVSDPDSGIYSIGLDRIIISTAGSGRIAFVTDGQRLTSDLAFGWVSAGDPTSALDAILVRDDIGVIAHRNGTNAQQLRIYKTFTDASNYRRLNIEAGSGSNYDIYSEHNGTGTTMGVRIYTKGTSDLSFGVNNAINWNISGATGHFLASTDNTYDIGASGANRPAILYLGTGLQSAGYVQAGASSYFNWNGRALLRSPSDGVLTLLNNSENDFNRLQFGGTSSSFPALKRNGTSIETKLADDSAYANSRALSFTADSTGHFNFNGRGALKASADGVFTLFDSTDSTFGRLQLGGTSASFPAIARSGTNIFIKLADDSGFTDIYAANFVATNSSFAFGGKSVIYSPSDGNILLANTASNSFGLLQLGGTTSSFPAWKRNGANMDARLADDSAFANIRGAALTMSGLVESTGSSVRTDGSSGGFLFSSRGGIVATSDGVITYTNSAGALGRISIGGITMTNTFISTPSALQTLAAANAISANARTARVTGSGGAVTLTSTPTIADGTDGQELIIYGDSSANTVTLQDAATLANSNLRLNAMSRVLGSNSVIKLVFNGNTSTWNEQGYSTGNGDSATIQAAGADTEIQYNDNDVLGASSRFTFNKTNVFTITSPGTGGSITNAAINGRIDDTVVGNDEVIFELNGVSKGFNSIYATNANILFLSAGNDGDNPGKISIRTATESVSESAPIERIHIDELGNTKVIGSFKVLSLGSPSVDSAAITNILTASATINFGSIGAGGREQQTISVTGAREGNPVFLGKPYLNTNMVFEAFCSSTNDVVVISAHNLQTVGNIDPASGDYTVMVFQKQ